MTDSSTKMHAYIINLDGAAERWRFVEERFESTGIPYTRISAVDGRRLTFPIPEYDAAAYRLRVGQRTNPSQVGCYLSHMKALQAFLASDHPLAIVAEDDAQPVANLRDILQAALDYRDTWDLLRLCGFHRPHPVPFATLPGNYELCACFTRLCGTGAYAVTRHAAKMLREKLLPMRLPIDHALDREWTFGLRSAAIMPLPVSQIDHPYDSQIAVQNYKLPWYRRYWTVFPWRASNETRRVIHRWRYLSEARRWVAQHTPRQATPST